jgi:hypothetical protein
MDGRLGVKLFDLVKLALKCIQQANKEFPRQLYIGEFGYKQKSEASLNFVRQVLNMVNEEDSEAVGRFRPLITIWVWEFHPQHDSLSIENIRDDWLVSEIANANKVASGAAGVLT